MWQVCWGVCDSELWAASLEARRFSDRASAERFMKDLEANNLRREGALLRDSSDDRSFVSARHGKRCFMANVTRCLPDGSHFVDGPGLSREIPPGEYFPLDGGAIRIISEALDWDESERGVILSAAWNGEPEGMCVKLTLSFDDGSVTDAAIDFGDDESLKDILEKAVAETAKRGAKIIEMREKAFGRIAEKEESE